jgi:hypothetical protein
MYPEHQLKPEDFLHFVELDDFVDDWKGLGLDVEMDLWALQIAIMSNPGGPPVIEGTGRLRKLRFAPSSWKVGKRGAVRVCYVYFPEHWTVLLVMAYAKNRKDSFSSREKRNIANFIKRIEKWFESQNY